MKDSKAAPRQQGAHPSCVDKSEWKKLVMADKSLTPAAKVVGCSIATFHNSTTGLCFPSAETVAEATNLGERAVQKAVVALKEAGFLDWTRPNGRSNYYELKRVPARQQSDEVPAHANASNTAPDKHRDTNARSGDDTNRGSGHDTNAGSGVGGDTNGRSARYEPPFAAIRTPVRTNPDINPGTNTVSRSRDEREPAMRSDSLRASTNVRSFPQPLSDDFELTRGRAQVAMAQGITLHQEIRDTFEKFQLHHRSKGTKSPDWESAWKLWCVNHKQFKKEKQLAQWRSGPAI